MARRPPPPQPRRARATTAQGQRRRPGHAAAATSSSTDSPPLPRRTTLAELPDELLAEVLCWLSRSSSDPVTEGCWRRCIANVATAARCNKTLHDVIEGGRRVWGQVLNNLCVLPDARRSHSPRSPLLRKNRFDPVVHPDSIALVKLHPKLLVQTRVEAIDFSRTARVRRFSGVEGARQRNAGRGRGTPLQEVEAYIDVAHVMALEAVSKNMEYLVSEENTVPLLISTRVQVGTAFEGWSRAAKFLHLAAHVEASRSSEIFLKHASFEGTEAEIFDRINFVPSSLTIDDAYRIYIFMSIGLRLTHNHIPRPLLLRPIGSSTLPVAQLLERMEGPWEGYYIGHEFFPLMTLSLSFVHDATATDPPTPTDPPTATEPPTTRPFVGNGEDSFGAFAVTGSVHLTTGAVHLRKQYAGDDAWDYAGFITEFGLLGSWGGGTFYLWRR
ncbi:hypothetical protein HDU96_001473 [Phlyctochytrium bullatum]|nr:hypothetical protein HDU96_001473 [Phlyctochytrium bullatum]